MRRPLPLEAAIRPLIALRAGLAAVALIALVVSLLAYAWDADDDDDGPHPGRAEQLSAQVTLADVQTHLQQFQQIADRNGGTRQAGTPGHERSVDYVAGLLRQAGFEVSTPSFGYEVQRIDAQLLDIEGTALQISQMTGSPNTPADGVSGPLVVLPDDDPTPGCDASDYADLPADGAVVLARRGSCEFSAKQRIATAAGAVALVVANNQPGLAPTQVEPGPALVPIGLISQADGNRLLDDAGADMTVDLRIGIQPKTSRTVIAETRSGDQESVVMAGAHLDSVEEGPGINDNGSGSAALLATALAMGSEPDVEHAIRFAWWGAEEDGLVGSKDYVENLDEAARDRIELYLNFDMVASPNAGYLVYDGDDSDRVDAPAGPPGSDRIEQEFVDRLREHSGIVAAGTDFTGRSDYGPFIEVGIPAGGLFTGAEVEKTPEQAVRWGGRPNVPYDPCYHQACDTLANIDNRALEANTDAIAWVVGRYASGAAEVPDR